MKTRSLPCCAFLITCASLAVFTPFPTRAQPANDAFANRILLSGTNVVTTGSNIGATKEAGEPNHAGNSGGASVWWTWTAPISESVTISTSGSGFDTVIGVYSGTAVLALTTVASNDDDPEAGDYTSKTVFSAVANQTYQIAVDGYGAAAGNVRLSVVQAPPVPPSSAPAWSLPDLYGNLVYSTNYAGKVVILDFWATWCGPCKAGMPDLVALQAKYAADGLVVVGADVSWSGETAQTVLEFLSTWTPTINYQIVMSNSGTESRLGSISAIPTTFIIDRQNLLRKKYVGTQSGSTLETQILPLLYGNTTLACRRSGNQLTLSWPTNAASFTLETATNLAGAPWSNWSVPPVVVAGTNTVQATMTNEMRYFRLRLPY